MWNGPDVSMRRCSPGVSKPGGRPAFTRCAPETTTLRASTGRCTAGSEPLSGSGTRGFTATVAVDDLAVIRDKVIANGGTIVYEQVEIPTVGTLTQFLDTEGNELAAMVYERPPFGA